MIATTVLIRSSYLAAHWAGNGKVFAEDMLTDNIFFLLPLVLPWGRSGVSHLRIFDGLLLPDLDDSPCKRCVRLFTS